MTSCINCKGFIKPGEQTIDTVDGLSHYDCWAVADDPAPRPVCPSCFLEITPAGSCGC